MSPQELEQILLQSEDISIEFKRCGSVPRNDTFETICSFANRQGGNIFLGIADDGTIVGVDEYRVREIERHIINVVSNPNVFNATPLIEFERIPTEKGMVLKVWIPIGPSVYRYKNVIYDRRGDADVRVRDDGQISMMYLRKQNMYTERRIYPYITTKDLRDDVIRHVRELIAARDVDHPWLKLDDAAMLRSAKLYGKDRETGAEGFTLAAALLLGSDDLISDVCPGYKTDAIVRLQDVDRYDDRRIVATNLIDAYDQLSDFARRYLPDPFALENGVAVSSRDIICRELISNLLIHREFSSSYIAKLVIDADGIRTDNASRAISEGEIGLENFNPTPKNPIIADFFHQIGRADELGSGTRNLVKYSALYSGQNPRLYEGDVFVAHVPVPWVGAITPHAMRATKVPAQSTRQLRSGSDGFEAMVMRLLEQNGTVTSAQLARAADVSSRTALRYLTGMVKRGTLVASGEKRNRVYQFRA